MALSFICAAIWAISSRFSKSIRFKVRDRTLSEPWAISSFSWRRWVIAIAVDIARFFTNNSATISGAACKACSVPGEGSSAKGLSSVRYVTKNPRAPLAVPTKSAIAVCVSSSLNVPDAIWLISEWVTSMASSKVMDSDDVPEFIGFSKCNCVLFRARERTANSYCFAIRKYFSAVVSAFLLNGISSFYLLCLG